MGRDPGHDDAAAAVRVLLGLFACFLLVGAVLGGYLLADSLAEEARLAGSGASGSEYLGVSAGYLLAIALLAPAVPAVPLGIFAVHPVRASLVAARVALALWWVMLAGAFIALTAMPGMEPGVLIACIGLVLMLAFGPAIGSVCTHLIARDTFASGS